MNEAPLSSYGIAYLASYIGIESLFGIDLKSSPHGQIELINLGILDAKGQLTMTSVTYVEMIRAYSKIENFLLIQDCVIGFVTSDLVMIVQHLEYSEESYYRFYMGDMTTVLKLALQHPIVAAAGYHYYITQTGETTSKESFNLSDEPWQFVATIYLKHEVVDFYGIHQMNHHYYKISTQLEATTLEIENESFEWLCHYVPKLRQTFMDKEVKHEKSNN